MADALLEVQDLVKYFPVYHRGVLMKKKVATSMPSTPSRSG